MLLVLLISLSDIFAVGGLFSRPRWSQTEYKKMWIKNVDADVDIKDQIAVTHIDQTFFNELDQSVEAVYIFPLPEKAMITEMVYWVNGKRFVAEIRERGEAVAAYNQKLQQWLDPALLEYMGDNLFRLKIVPIEANTEVRTEITYVEPLQYDMGEMEYKFLLNTTGLSSKPLERVSVDLNASTQHEYNKFESPSHGNSLASKLEKVSDSQYKFFYGDENYVPKKDLVLKMATNREQINYTVLTYTPEVSDSMGEDSFFSLWITPPDTIDQNKVIPKNIVFTVDVSSSMEGTRIEQVKEAMNEFISLLNPQDKFNIITFGTFVNEFKTDLVEANSDNIEEAKDFIYQTYAMGLTNIDEAIEKSLSQSFADESSNNIVFLTDGEPTWGEINPDSILANIARTNDNNVRIFPFGVGEELNRSLLADMAKANHGLPQFISKDDSIAIVVNNHFTRISKPVLTNLEITFNGLDTYDHYPKVIGDLFWGSQIMYSGRYSNSGNFEVKVKGKNRNETVEFTQIINFSDTLGGHRFVPRLWAKEKIDHLLNLIKSYGESQELIDQIVALSLQFQILTPYTAMYSDPDEDPTSVKEESIPEAFSLAQNYPNPFNPSTTIAYELPANNGDYHVIIKIYNTLGELVKVLFSGYQKAGHHELSWNGKGTNGFELPSGIYIYTIEAGKFNASRKMILLK